MAPAATLTQEYGVIGMLVDGKWRSSEGQQILSVYDPGRGAQIGRVAFATKEEVTLAVESAHQAFLKWREQPLPERLKLLFKMKEVLERRSEDLASINTQNHGKTIQESRGDVRRAIDNVDAAIAVIQTVASGRVMPQISEGIDESMVKEPLGVFAIVSPFNFPIMIPFWFIPYALGLGDTLVVKPSEIDPLPTYMTVKILQEELKLPPGVINLVNGGKDVVEWLVSSKLVRGVTFVGSTPVAKAVYRLAGEHGKRVLSNGGAKNSIVVLPDANLPASVPSIVSSFFGNTGQRCLAGSNLVCVGKSHEELARKFTLAARGMKIGYGLEPASEMGPVVSDQARRRILGHIEKGVSDKAKLISDGRKVQISDYSGGYYLGPTIFDDVSRDMSIARDEIFGPVASIIPVETVDDAIDMINTETEYGNMASIFTASGRAASDFARRVDAGNVGVNIGVASPAAIFPFGGRRDSFFGTLHAQSDTVDFFTDKKVVISRW